MGSGVARLSGRWRLGPLWRRTWSVFAASAVLLAGLPGTAEAQDRPDLKVEEVKLFVNNDGQVSDRAVSFKVTNVGKADASEATGKLEILSPPPTKEEGLKLGKIAKGASVQGFAQLPGPCDGHTVKVTLKAPNETNLGNNAVGPVKLCESKSPPKPPSTQTGGVVLSPVGDVAAAKPEPAAQTKIDTDLLVLPEHMRPGPHDVSLNSSATHPWFKERHLGDEEEQTDCEPVHRPPQRVGWLQSEQKRTGPLGIVVSRCAFVAEAQLGVNFDYRILDDVRTAPIIRAELTFDETASAWFETDGSPRQATGCVSAVGIATADLELGSNSAEPFPAESYRDVTPNASTRFDVRSAVQQHVWNERPRFGFVLRGSLSIDQLTAEGVSSCMSAVEKIRLEIHYVVPD